MSKIINEKDYSLYKVLTTFQICIPIIQRDYIQGLNDESRGIKDKRERLINDIFENLRSHRRLNLNIVYGIHEKEIFYPLDGQQRLTMIYLLHWFLAINSNKFEEFYKLKPFYYETRTSSNEFFAFLRAAENKNKWNKIFNEVGKSKLTFLKQIKNQTWFKIQWFTDTTVFSAINVIGDFIEKIQESDFSEYYDQLTENKSKLCFDFLSENIEDAESVASTNYIRLNSRGKQLEEFENVKAVLAIIEHNLNRENDKKFAHQYDQKYINIFYNECLEELELDAKTKEINKKSITLLINTYNLLNYIKFNEAQLNDFNTYYSQIFIESKKKSNLNFWEEYFDFLNCLLNTVINNKNILEYINKFWNDKYQYNEKNNVDNNKLIIYLRYIYYFYQNQEQYVNEKHLEKLKYVLDNLKYDEWKQKKLQTTELLAKHSSRYKDVFEYFSKRESNEVIGDLGLVKYNCEINDIKFRVKEQSIKSKIIAKIKENPEKFENPNVDYNFFECVEKKSEKRQIQYIFQISDMWEKEITIEKIEKLLKYIRVAKIFFCDINNRLLWRKLFAIATCWNEREDRLLNSEDINKKTNDRYINEKNNKPIDNNNIYYWKDDYYFIWDDMKEKANDSYIIRGKKKNIIKIAYEICTKNKLYEEKERREWLINQFNESYNNCWLKYAVDRDYDELLIKNISYNEISGILYINVKYFDEYGEHQKKANFFGMIYILDKDKNEWSSNLYYTSVWDYDSKRINSYVKENGISVNSLRNSKKIINQFGLRLLWNSCYEKKFSYEANGIRTIERYFFYYIQSYDFFNEENSVIAIDNGKVIITNFGGNNLYTQLKYDFGNSIEKANVEGNIDICINEIRKYKQLSDIDNNKWKEYSYNYNNQSIHKCSFKNVINSSIGKALFDSVNAGQGQVLEFRKLK